MGKNYDSATSIVVGGLTKGRYYTAYVAAVNRAGMGKEGKDTGGPRVAISVPGATTVAKVTVSLVSGKASVQWAAVADTGDLTGAVPLLGIYFDFSASPSMSGGVVTVLVGPGGLAAGARDFGSGEGVSVSKGQVLYVRGRALNMLGTATEANITGRLVVSEPSEVLSLKIYYGGGLALNATWQPPLDKGAGAGVDYPIGFYQVAIYPYEGALDLTNPQTALTLYGPGSSFALLPSLAAGTFYRVAARAQNDATDSGGYGPWSSLGVGICVDGTVRPTACGLQGMYAIGLPTLPLGVKLVPHGERTLMASWWVMMPMIMLIYSIMAESTRFLQPPVSCRLFAHLAPRLLSRRRPLMEDHPPRCFAGRAR